MKFVYFILFLGYFFLIVYIVFFLIQINFQHAVVQKVKSKGEKKEHWLDYASDKYDGQLISDIKATLKVLLLYIPIPVFWALFDQQVNIKLNYKEMGLNIFILLILSGNWLDFPSEQNVRRYWFLHNFTRSNASR